MRLRNEQIPFGKFQGYLGTSDVILSRQSTQSGVCFLTMKRAVEKDKLSCRGDFGKRHQALIFFIPQMQICLDQTFLDRQDVHLSKAGMIFNRFGQAVKRDAAGKVVDMVDADICGHPLEKAGQDVVRAAV